MHSPTADIHNIHTAPHLLRFNVLIDAVINDDFSRTARVDRTTSTGADHLHGIISVVAIIIVVVVVDIDRLGTAEQRLPFVDFALLLLLFVFSGRRRRLG